MSDTPRSLEDRIADYRVIVADLTERIAAMQREFDEKVIAAELTIERYQTQLRCMTDDLNDLLAKKAEIDAAIEAIQ